MEGRAASYAVSQAADSVQSKVGSAFNRGKDKAQGKEIDWVDLNWPCRKEPFALLHFDLQELKEKRGQDAFALTRMMYAWWFLILTLVFWNFLSACILTGSVGDKDIYSGVNIFYSILMFCIGAILGVLCFYKVYEGVGGNEKKPKKHAQYAIILMCIFMIIVALVGNGNVNGFATFGTSAYNDAKDKDMSITPYWTAIAIIEPLLWIVATGIAIYALYRVRKFSKQSSSNSSSASSSHQEEDV